MDTLGQTTPLRQPSDRPVLHSNQAAVVHEAAAVLVGEVTAALGRR
jgi:hypothetical protein